MVYVGLAVLLTTTCLVLIFLSWRKKLPEQAHTPCLIAAWSGLLLCWLPWKAALGAETGSVVTLCFPAFAAWTLIAWNRQHKDRTSAAQIATTSAADTSYRANRVTGSRKVLLVICRVFQASVLALAASVSFGTALTVLLGLDMQNAMAVTVLLLPFLWGVGAWWAAADDNWWQPALGLTGITFACTTITLLLGA